MKCGFCEQPAVGRIRVRVRMPYCDGKIAKEMTSMTDRAVCGRHYAEFSRATQSGIPWFAWKLRRVKKDRRKQ